MARLRRMQEELQRRNYAQTTIDAYIFELLDVYLEKISAGWVARR